jgi:uncharacterized protein
MLKGIFENSSPGRKLLLLFFLLLGALLIAAIFSLIISMLIWGNDIRILLETPDYNDSRIVAALKLSQLISFIGGLLLPALAFLWITDAEFYNCRKHGSTAKRWSLLLTLTFILCIQPFIGLLSDWNQMLKLPQALSGIENWIRAKEDNAGAIAKAFVSTTSVSGLIYNIVLMAVIPAFSEELVFRAALGRLFKNWTHSIHWAAILTAFVFSAIHIQFYGFLPRFVLGLGLAYLFFWSGSIWWPIAAHFINNFIAVMAAFLFQNGYTTIDPEKVGTFDSVYPGLISLFITLFLIFIFKRVNSGKKTELT